MRISKKQYDSDIQTTREFEFKRGYHNATVAAKEEYMRDLAKSNIAIKLDTAKQCAETLSHITQAMARVLTVLEKII